MTNHHNITIIVTCAKYYWSFITSGFSSVCLKGWNLFIFQNHAVKTEDFLTGKKLQDPAVVKRKINFTGIGLALIFVFVVVWLRQISSLYQYGVLFSYSARLWNGKHRIFLHRAICHDGRGSECKRTLLHFVACQECQWFPTVTVRLCKTLESTHIHIFFWSVIYRGSRAFAIWAETSARPSSGLSRIQTRSRREPLLQGENIIINNCIPVNCFKSWAV